MADFPRLKTGAIAQDGFRTAHRRAVRLMRYVDGTEQAIKLRRAERRWAIRLSMLDEGEIAQIVDLFNAVQGRVQTFAFTDPVTGTRHERCRFEGEELETVLAESHDGRAVLAIVEEVE